MVSSAAVARSSCPLTRQVPATGSLVISENVYVADAVVRLAAGRPVHCVCPPTKAVVPSANVRVRPSSVTAAAKPWAIEVQTTRSRPLVTTGSPVVDVAVQADRFCS
ncbi:MAG: hypothetical protein D6761_06525 [Candidatus Dadabacteria bacterium]|nr:MAG: hypothetical protein D6761_06525 [Candidatus Dadabacteria bacterium]